jgi:hypothetical protein
MELDVLVSANGVPVEKLGSRTLERLANQCGGKTLKAWMQSSAVSQALGLAIPQHHSRTTFVAGCAGEHSSLAIGREHRYPHRKVVIWPGCTAVLGLRQMLLQLMETLLGLPALYVSTKYSTFK